MLRRCGLVLMLVLGLHAWGAPAVETAGSASVAYSPLGAAGPVVWSTPPAMELWGVAADAPWGDAASTVECGGAGQFACIENFSYVGPYNGCNTDRLVNRALCLVCGGTGQLACDFGPQCNAPGDREIAGSCTYRGHSSEPTPGVSVMPTLAQAATGPVRGIVDLHVHQFSNLGFGGVVFWGAPYDAGGIDEALPWCDYTWKFGTKMALSGLPGPGVPFLGHEVHGPPPLVQVFANPIGVVMGEGLHDVSGTGSFAGWPTYKTVTHQQMYYKWVERAYLGGVRMMVQLAVSNEALCGMGKIRNGFTCDDMEAVDKQIQATKDLEAAIDREDDGWVNGSGWYRIAYSPAQARALIRAGKMAVVLGIEVDSLFGCKPGVGCSEAYLRGQLQHYYDLGVRHVFPIHQYDNGFGGAAVFKDELNAANRIVAGHHFQVRDCSAQGYSYNVNSSVATDFLALLLHGAELPNQSYYDQFAADCNAGGLTAMGRTLINAMMDTGFVIDVDHMSRSMLDDVLAIAVSRNYPLVSGHSSPRGGQGGSEFSLTDAQMATLKQLGGMVSAINPRGDCSTSAAFSFNYNHLVTGMGQKPGDRYAAVGFATDMNGFGGSTSPRFGIPNCPAEVRGVPGTELQYPFAGMMGGSFNRQVTGSREFNFNTEGIAQYGQLADFFADVRNNFLSSAALEPLLNSAESYIRMWGRAVPGGTTPTVRAIVSGTQDPRGFAYVSDVHLRWEVTGADAFDIDLSGCADQVITQDTGSAGQTFTCTASAYVEDSDYAHVVVGADAESINIRRDTTPPTVTWGPLPWTPTPGWYNHDVVFPFTVFDLTTGVDGDVDRTLVLTSEGLAVTGTVTVRDNAGNTATYTSPPVSIDKTAPEISYLNQAPVANAAGWNRENPTLTWACADALSGPAAAEVQNTLTVEGAGMTLTGQCTDLAGNVTSDTRSGLNLDRTAPTLEWAAAAPAANAAGWSNTDVVFAFTPGDALSGVAGTSQPSPLVLVAEGAAVTGTVSVTDVADNTATFTSPSVRIDKTAPVVNCVASPSVIWPPNGKLVPVSVDLSVTDALSGVATYVITEASSNEPGAATDIVGFAVQGQAVIGAVRAQRTGGGTGRIYTFGYLGTDLAGNTASCSTVVTVPHDQKGNGGKGKGGR